MIEERLSREQHDTIDGIAEPSENPNLFGHDEVADRLAGAYQAGKLHHAIILAGPYGIGKATLAFRLANHLISHPDHRAAPATLTPSGPESPVFRQIAQGAHPAVLYLTRPANDRTKGFRSAITVDEVRRVGRFLSTTAHDGGYRVVIVDPAGDMNTNAANALLKNLEEPPARSIFILVAHSAGRLLPTIRSRCQIVRLQPLSPDALVRALEASGTDVPQGPGARTTLIEQAGGSVRNALLLTHYGGLEIAAAMHDVIEAGTFPVAGAARIADAVAGRDQSVQLGIFNDGVLELVAARAAAAAQAGETGRAARLADLWHALQRSRTELEVFNLDKRQHVIATLAAVQEAVSA